MGAARTEQSDSRMLLYFAAILSMDSFRANTPPHMPSRATTTHRHQSKLPCRTTVSTGWTNVWCMAASNNHWLFAVVEAGAIVIIIVIVIIIIIIITV
jgi:hypothetical protein